jgi:4-hydroxy-2-oxoheptanedioate aldolase
VGTRAANYGFNLTLDEYTQQANNEMLVCVQIEDKDALANITAIASVEGIDVIFIGPSDLSQSLGHPGNYEHPVVREVMQNAFKTILKSPKAAGTAGNFELTATRLEQGVTYYYIHLTTLLARGCSEFFRAAQRSSR